jgi:hypothetical protein
MNYQKKKSFPVCVPITPELGKTTKKQLISSLEHIVTSDKCEERNIQ